MLSEEKIWKRLRTICLRLPRATEGLSFGHPTFRVDKKIFLVMEEYKGELGICLKVGKLLHGIFLKDARFFSTPYIGKQGWVTLRVHAAPLDLNEIRQLVKDSYQLVTPKKLPRKWRSLLQLAYFRPPEGEPDNGEKGYNQCNVQGSHSRVRQRSRQRLRLVTGTRA
jgi:predicted DNA-binding protein (MmcQ/YjbR family)